jgi:hypothetical protein
MQDNLHLKLSTVTVALAVENCTAKKTESASVRTRFHL